MTNTADLLSALSQFTGGGDQYLHWSKRIQHTEGVQFVAEQAGAFWLVDAIASHQPKALRNARLREFQLWTLAVKNRKAVLTCREDSDCKPAITQRIPFTDFPLSQIRLYVCNGVLLLPSEY